MSLRISALALIAVVLAVSGCANQVDLDHERTLLLDQDKQWSEAIAENDMDKVVDFWTEDAVIYPSHGSAVRGKDDILKFVERNRIQWGLSLKTTPQEALVFASGDVGYTVGTYDFFGVDAKGDSIDLPGKYLSIWQKTPDEGWKCVLEFHSETTEPMEKILKEGMSGS